MNIVKTTVSLTTPEEINELLRQNPEIELKLSSKAVAQLAIWLKDKIGPALDETLKSALTWKYNDSEWLYLSVSDGKSQLHLGSEAERKIREYVGISVESYIKVNVKHLVEQRIDAIAQQVIEKNRLDETVVDQLLRDKLSELLALQKIKQQRGTKDECSN